MPSKLDPDLTIDVVKLRILIAIRDFAHIYWHITQWRGLPLPAIGPPGLSPVAWPMPHCHLDHPPRDRFCHSISVLAVRASSCHCCPALAALTASLAMPSVAPTLPSPALTAAAVRSTVGVVQLPLPCPSSRRCCMVRRGYRHGMASTRGCCRAACPCRYHCLDCLPLPLPNNLQCSGNWHTCMECNEREESVQNNITRLMHFTSKPPLLHKVSSMNIDELRTDMSRRRSPRCRCKEREGYL
jgi:hypothetical protein